MKQIRLNNESFEYLEMAFKEWLDVLGYAEATVYNLPNHIREFLKYLENQGHSHITTITQEDFKNYFEELQQRSNVKRGGGLSNAYLNKHLQALYKFTEYLRKNAKITLPYLDINWQEHTSKQIEILTIEEVKELYKSTEKEYVNRNNMEALQKRDKAMLSIFYGCGLRRNEAVRLNVDDVHWDKSILHVKYGKGYKERFVPFNKTNRKILQDWVFDYRPQLLRNKNEQAFFIGNRGSRLGGQSLLLRLNFLQLMSDDIHLQNKEISLHTLRHSIATHFLQAGMELEKISKFLGHSSLESTQIYTHLAVRGDNYESYGV